MDGIQMLMRSGFNLSVHRTGRLAASVILEISSSHQSQSSYDLVTETRAYIVCAKPRRTARRHFAV